MRLSNLQAWVLSFAMMAPVSCEAASLIQARCEIPSAVIMDGVAMGTTPLNISAVAPGDHEIAFQALGTRAMRAYRVRIPYSASVTTTVAADFNNSGPVVVEAVPIAAVAPACAAPVVVATRPIVLRQSPVIIHAAPPVIVVQQSRGRHRGRGHRGFRR